MAKEKNNQSHMYFNVSFNRMKNDEDCATKEMLYQQKEN